MYYDLLAAGARPLYVAAAPDVVRGYESLLGEPDGPLTLFKALPVFADPDMEAGTLEFRDLSRALGIISAIS